MKTMQHSDWLDDHDHPPASAGSRGDNSVAFSLNALMARETAARKPVATSTPASADSSESGLIDLSALRASETLAHSHHLEVFPFGAPAHAHAPVEDPIATAPAPRRRSRAARYAVIALLTAVAAGAGLFAGQRAPRAELGPPAAVGLSQAARALAARLPRHDAVTDTPAAHAQDAEARAATKDAPVTVAVLQRAPVDRARRTAASTPRTDGSRPAPQVGTDKRVPPPADPCNGDLTCAMRRAAGG